MKNLLQETIAALQDNDKEPEDVKWVGNLDVNHTACFTWIDFVKAADFNYDEYASFADICNNLVIVGDDWWLERAWYYTGLYHWSFKTLPECEERYLVIPDEYDLRNPYKHIRPFKSTFGGQSAEIITNDLSLSNENDNDNHIL